MCRHETPRNFGVQCLDKTDDEELFCYLPQLLQALKCTLGGTWPEFTMVCATFNFD